LSLKKNQGHQNSDKDLLNCTTTEIRQAAEKALGPKFDVLKFHNFILSQGLLPPVLLRKAVLEGLTAQ